MGHDNEALTMAVEHTMTANILIEIGSENAQSFEDPIPSEKNCCPGDSYWLAKCTQVHGGEGHPDVPFIRAPKMNLGCQQKIWCKSVLGDIFWVWTA